MSFRLWMGVAVLLLSGCASRYPSPEAPDLSGTYDGVWWVSMEVTEPYQGRFNCRPGNTKELLFIRSGRVGTLSHGPDGGRVDTQGNLVLRQPLEQTFATHGASKRMASELVLRGKMSETGAGGELIHALKGSTRGCKGTFTAIKKDVVASIKDQSAVREFPVSVRWAGIQFDNARLWTRPLEGNAGSWMVLEGVMGTSCRGWWQGTGDAPRGGEWRLYCGGRLWVRGVWDTQSGTWQARGEDSLGRPVTSQGEV